MLNFQDFKERAKREIIDFLPENGSGYHVEETKAQKVNQGTVSMLTVRKEGNAIAASISLESIYKDYEHSGVDFDVFFHQFAPQFCEQAVHTPDYVVGQANRMLDMNWEKVSSMVYVHAIGASRNEELLQNVPHKQVGDVCAVYRIHLADTPEGSATVLVTNDMAKRMGVSQEELHKTAVQNSVNRFPPVCLRMSDMMGQLLDTDTPFKIEPEDDVLYVLTNRTKMEGAGVIFYPDVADTIYRNMPENYYLIPSSVHEWLVVSKNRADKESLEEMVHSVNETTVDPKEQLSDMVHEYDPVHKLVYAGQAPEFPKKDLSMEERAPAR